VTVILKYTFTDLNLYYILALFVFPILYIPDHAASGGHDIADQVCVEAITVPLEEQLILSSTLSPVTLGFRSTCAVVLRTNR